jgi:hypothetical protein
MPGVGFEPTALAFEMAKTVHVLDRAAAVNSSLLSNIYIYIEMTKFIKCLRIESGYFTHVNA